MCLGCAWLGEESVIKALTWFWVDRSYEVLNILEKFLWNVNYSTEKCPLILFFSKFIDVAYVTYCLSLNTITLFC